MEKYKGETVQERPGWISRKTFWFSSSFCHNYFAHLFWFFSIVTTNKNACLFACSLLLLLNNMFSFYFISLGVLNLVVMHPMSPLSARKRMSSSVKICMFMKNFHVSNWYDDDDDDKKCFGLLFSQRYICMYMRVGNPVVYLKAKVVIAF